MNRRPQMLLGAIAFTAALIGAAFLLLRGPQDDPTRLLTALDAFTGEWEGDASIQSSDGKPLHTLRMTRRYSWVGEKQIVETRFVHGAEEFSTRAIQWIEDDHLKAVGIGPKNEANEFAGAPTADGILWTNRHRPKADQLDRIVTQDGRTTVQTASISPMQLGSISDLVGVAAVLLPRTIDEASVVAATEAAADLATRVTELEHKLAFAELERERLRARLEQIRSAPAPADNAVAADAALSTRATSTGALPRPSQLEIRSSPPGLKFEVRREEEANLVAAVALFAGTTPETLTSVPPGNYAVILQRAGQRKTVHHITVKEFTDVFLFHREEGAATRTPITPANEGSPAPTLPSPGFAPDTSTPP